MPIEIAGERFLDVHEMADILGVTEREVRKRLRQGEIEGIRTAGSWLIPERAATTHALSPSVPATSDANGAPQASSWGADRRVLIIRTIRDVFDNELLSETTVELPAGDMDEVPQRLDQEIRLALVDRGRSFPKYSISDQRIREEMGAGVAGQEIVLVLAAAALSGAAEAIVSDLVQWALSRFSSGGLYAPLEDPVADTSKAVSKDFGAVPPIRTVEMSGSVSGYTCVLEDGQGTRYRVEKSLGPLCRITVTRLGPDLDSRQEPTGPLG